MKNRKHTAVLIAASLVSALISSPTFAAETSEIGYPAGEPSVILTTASNSGYDCDLASATNSGLSYSLDEAKKEMTITSYTGKGTKLVISSNYGGYKVTKIGEKAFYGGGYGNDQSQWTPAAYLTEITLPDTVTEIAYEAFFRCRSLKSFEMPDSVTTLGFRTFVQCYSLESFKISEKVSGGKLNSCLAGCKNLKKLYFPTAISELHENYPIDSKTAHPADLDDCDNLKDIYFTGSLKKWREIKLIGRDDEHGNVYHDPTIYRAKIHLNSTLNDFRSGKNAGNGDDLNAAFDNKTVTLGSASISYNSSIAFYNKKYTLENFGEITVSYNGKAYKVSKLKFNKKKKKLQITALEGADKAASKEIKKLTKGSKGLDIAIVPYILRYDSDVKCKMSSDNKEILNIWVKINGSYFNINKHHKQIKVGKTVGDSQDVVMQGNDYVIGMYGNQ